MFGYEFSSIIYEKSTRYQVTGYELTSRMWLRVFGERILKQNVFSEALATVFPTATLQIYHTAVHILLFTNLLIWVTTSLFSFNIINYRFVNVNVLNDFNPQKGS